MSKETTRPIGTTIGEDGVHTGLTIMSPIRVTTRAQCKVPPSHVVPIIFVPGIMGSNLRDRQTQKNIWGLNSQIGMLFQWGFRSASTRQRKLDPDKAEVDPNGGFPGASATVPTAKVAMQRGWGAVAKMSYGAFLRWLDDRLNEDFCGSSTAGDGKSPWADFEGKDDWGKTWGAQKAFQAITPQESTDAWNDFYCPVHAVGYNWLKSNADSGKVLAEEIKKIIEYWNNFTDKTTGEKIHYCKKVILVSHSMGGLVTRAAVHEKFGNAANLVYGIVHGEQPANGAPAAYHHCRSGYGGMPGIVLGRNAAQVTAVFANSPGAMELLPNAQYPVNWLKVVTADHSDPKNPVFQLPASNPYTEIYAKKDTWWRLVDPNLIDPAHVYTNATPPVDPWNTVYRSNIKKISDFHEKLGRYYHPQTYVHYGADAKKYPAWGDLMWKSVQVSPVPVGVLQKAKPGKGSNPVTILGANFEIVDPATMGYEQSGDGTVPACSGEAPNTQGGGNVKQSFRMQGFEHQDAYNDLAVRQVTLHAIGKLLQEAK